MSKKSKVSLDSLSGGLNMYDEPDKVPLHQSPLSKNSRSVQKGSIEKSTGYKVLIKLDDAEGKFRGHLKYIKIGTGGFSKQVLVHTDTIYTWDFENGLVEIGTMGGITTDAKVRGVIHDNEMIFGDGVNPTKRYDGDTLTDLKDESSEADGAFAPKGNSFQSVGGILLIRDAGADGESVFRYCDPADVEKWTPQDDNNAGHITPGNGKGEKIKASGLLYGNLIVYKETSIYKLSINFDSENLTVGFGAAEAEGIGDGSLAEMVLDNINNGIYSFGKKGFAKYGQQENFPDSRSYEEFSFAIRPLLATIKKQYTENISFIDFDYKYIASVPLEGSSVNNALIYFDYFNKSWWVDIKPVETMVSGENEYGEDTVFFTHSTEPKLCMMTDKYIDDEGDNNLPIEFYHRTPTIRTKEHAKNGMYRVDGEISENGDIEVRAVVDGKPASWQKLSANEAAFEEEAEKEGMIVGSSFVGNSAVGSGKGTAVRKFSLMVQFPGDLNEGQEVFLEIRHNRVNEGCKIRGIYILIDGKLNRDFR